MNIGFSQLAISELGYVQSCHFETKNQTNSFAKQDMAVDPNQKIISV